MTNFNNFNLERVPGTVELDEIACCALKHAFEKNPEIVAQLEKMVDKKTLASYPGELAMTERIVFVPSEEAKTVYSQIAKAELKRLAHENEDLSCGHTSEEHKEALESAEAMFLQSVN